MANQLALNAAELLRRPGIERSVSIDVAASELDLDDPRLAPDANVHVDVRLESLSDAVVVDGSLTVPWSGMCRRCLASIDGTLDAEVHELFQLRVVDPDASPIVGDVLDLAPVVREIVLVELPFEPTCRPDCAGLCPVCGIDRNVATCRCDARAVDRRWAALEQLRGIVDDS